MWWTRYYFDLCIKYYFELQDPPNLNSLDEDVVAERQRVTSLMRDSQQNSDALLVTDLRKEFGNIGSSKKFTAVDGMTFGVKQGECFGLLGVNGAGKTTSFR